MTDYIIERQARYLYPDPENGQMKKALSALTLSVFASSVMALEPLRFDEDYDFGTSDMPARLSELGKSVSDYRDFWKAPSFDHKPVTTPILKKWRRRCSSRC